MSEQQIISILTALRGHVVLFLEQGPLKKRLIERWRETTDDLATRTPSGLAFSNLSVKVEIRYDMPTETLTITWQCLGASGEEKTDADNVSLAALQEEEMTDLVHQLVAANDQKKAISTSKAKPRTILIKNKPSHNVGEISGLLDCEKAASYLGVPHTWLKKWIPCTEFREQELTENGVILEYYWDAALIKRLKGIMDRDHTRTERKAFIEFIAQECCGGDKDWAGDILRETLKPNRLKC